MLRSTQPIGHGLLLAALLFTSAPSLLGQVPGSDRGDPGKGTPGIRIAATFLDFERGRSAVGSVEITLLSTWPRVWRMAGMAGVMTSGRGQTYGYAGLHLPVELPLGFTARASVAAGVYEKGRGHELGSPLEFRSGIALEREFIGEFRVSAFLYHLSNAGLGFRNPGLEALGFGISLPVKP